MCVGAVESCEKSCLILLFYLSMLARELIDK